MEINKLFDTMLEHMAEGIIVIDSEGIITHFNEPASGIAGVDGESVIGKHLLKVFGKLKQDQSTLMRVLKYGEPVVDFLQEYENARGEKQAILSSTFPILENGMVIGAFEIYRDLKPYRMMIEKLGTFIVSKKNKDSRTIHTCEAIVGKHPSIIRLKEKIASVALTPSTVLITGETGTGKELVAQALHSHSARSNKPFVAQNCAAIPGTLLESVLFGTVIGSFTGAKNTRGLFELANGGTLFLDEINAMPYDLQSKLLRVLQDGVVRPIGSEVDLVVDVRVVASSNSDLKKAIRVNEFRPDLYYRLNVVGFHLPALRERISDIGLLVDHFSLLLSGSMDKPLKHFDQSAIEILTEKQWEGNIRELKALIERIYNLYETTAVDKMVLLECIEEDQEPAVNAGVSKTYGHLQLKSRVASFEINCIQEALSATGGHISKAADLLGLPKQTLHNKMKKYELTAASQK
ncbi:MULTISPECIES: sigma-54-dependent Fis family transcriptional regulator [unclassified Fusibacter]|uniref:sigma-54 interaction domain-containing protein n=1 Tax=unclassified Fusibacter TaxID=2624464 RepID=UPI0013E90350|nr:MULTISPECIES: sigma 54-interacting transcriptional regulator [unclassified Fusibacter]MCK8059924.1 sigma 54-interacting transcriptional regulator [Fusibacter sp. A2]NPE22066.1 sigma 54-interacting transcriptional regulator [Fusibacter sp. A1]